MACETSAIITYINEEYNVVTNRDVFTPMPLVCSASWGEGSDYDLVPTIKGPCLLKCLRRLALA